ncbi:ATP-binding protein [Thiomicrorhabdus aquaedulcis]|uniref:ATP-binding protein n=1 Tax=Thiomicrorhabdus aquaedulcis TaxID=2211106 RepID=UPI000FDB4113|nr:ATP-binding protein [Thiomicrorhabdus aquaedulcis]
MFTSQRIKADIQTQKRLDYLHISTLKLVLNNNLSSSLGNFGVASLLTLILAQFTPSLTLWLWFAFMALVSVARLLIGFNFAKKIEKHYQPSYNKLMFALVVLTALGWGVSALLFIDSNNPLTNAYITIALAGIVAGSTASLIPIKHYFYSFLLIILIPVLLVYSTMGEMANYLFAVMILVFILFMLRNGKLFNQNITKNLELLYENNQLIENLHIQKNKALEASMLKSQFLANMSHEIRTPMNAIIGFIHLLKEEETEPKKVNYLNTVIEASQNLLNIINDILDFSKIESNQMMLEQKAFNPQIEVQNCLDLFASRFNTKHIKTTLIVNNNVPEYAVSDAFRIKQILNNLLSNAVKFSPEYSEITVEITYQLATQTLHISVKDQGIGIAPEKQSSIFNAFIQADASTTRKYGGTGLGLAISTKLTKLLGGDISVQSELGLGSQFTFSVVAPISSNDTLKKTHTSTIKMPTQLAGHVLIVEDNIINQKLLTTLLKKVGLTSEVANDGLEAVEAFKNQTNNQTFNIILMDENMPNLSGIEATQRIRQLEKTQNLPPMPIIAVTANAMEGDSIQFLTHGLNEYLTKPINVPLLYSLLERYLTKAVL